MDAYDLFDPVDILTKLPENFTTNLESKKWQERKEALEALLQLISSNPRLSDKANYGDLANRLRHVLEKDANINTAAVATKCITGLARGVRQKFGIYATTFAGVIFEKFKEKKPVLREPLIECIDAVYSTTNLDNLNEEIMKAFGKPNPNIKIQLDSFLYRAFKKLSSNKAPKPLLKDVVPALIKHSVDPDADVRDASFMALGAIMKCLGEKVAFLFFGELATDKIKMAKIEEYHKKAVEEAKIEAEQEASEAPAQPPQVSTQKEDKEEVTTAKEINPWEMFEPVDILPKIPESFSTNLESKKWQERKEALEALLQLISSNPRLSDKANYGELADRLREVLEKDANINTAAVATKCITGLARGVRQKFGIYATAYAGVIFEKFKEKKPVLREPLIECIDAVYSTTNLDNLNEEIMKAIGKTNPNIKIQLDLFLYRAFKKLPSNKAPKSMLKILVPALIKHSVDSDADVRDASFSALGAIMKCLGEKVALMFFGELTSDKIKMAKIEEYYKKAVEETKGDPQEEPEEQPKETKKAPAKKKVAPGKGTKAKEETISEDEPEQSPNATNKPNSSKTKIVAKKPVNTRQSVDGSKPNINETLTVRSRTRQSINVLAGNTKFQLDPKFFVNEFDPLKDAAKNFNTESIDLNPIQPAVNAKPTPSFHKRSESMSSISSMESAEQIDRTVYNLSCLSMKIAEEAMAQLLHLFQEQMNRVYLIDRTELILQNVVTQFTHIRTRHLENIIEKDGNAAELAEFLRTICLFINTLVKDNAIVEKISMKTMQSFLDGYFVLATDERFRNLNGFEHVYRSMNNVAVRLCESSHSKTCFVALMKLLMQYQETDPEGKIILLIRKCIFKHLNRFFEPDFFKEIDLQQVFDLFYEWFNKFYVDPLPESVKETVRTLTNYTHRIILAKRYKTLSYLCTYDENSYMVKHMRRCVRSLSKNTQNSNQTLPSDNTTVALNNNNATNVLQEELMALFNRISEDIFDGCVEELYNIMDLYPEQNGNFEQQMLNCEYASIIRRAFCEIRRTRLEKKTMNSGDCILRIMSQEDQAFFARQNAIQAKIDTALGAIKTKTN